jgi:hypothetical protein
MSATKSSIMELSTTVENSHTRYSVPEVDRGGVGRKHNAVWVLCVSFSLVASKRSPHHDVPWPSKLSHWHWRLQQTLITPPRPLRRARRTKSIFCFLLVSFLHPKWRQIGRCTTGNPKFTCHRFIFQRFRGKFDWLQRFLVVLKCPSNSEQVRIRKIGENLANIHNNSEYEKLLEFFELFTPDAAEVRRIVKLLFNRLIPV